MYFGEAASYGVGSGWSPVTLAPEVSRTVAPRPLRESVSSCLGVQGEPGAKNSFFKRQFL